MDSLVGFNQITEERMWMWQISCCYIQNVVQGGDHSLLDAVFTTRI